MRAVTDNSTRPMGDIVGNLQIPEELVPAVPLKVYITPFAEQNVREAEKWSTDAAKEALNVVNAIWSKANLSFVMSDCVVDKQLDMAKSVRNNDQGRAWAHELGHLMSLDHVDVDYADERQAALRSNLMTKGLSTGRDLTAKQIGKVKGSKLVSRFAA
jgi:hypothetical protein